jgi:hypothetical protein
MTNTRIGAKPEAAAMGQAASVPYLSQAVVPNTNLPPPGMPFIPPESYQDKETKQYSLLEHQYPRLACGLNAKQYERPAVQQYG